MSAEREQRTDADADDALGALLTAGVGELVRERVAAARLDAELLLAFASGLARSVAIAFPERRIGVAAAARYRELVARRAAGEPLAYLTGSKEFYSLPLTVTRDVLVPRPETELLVDEVLARLPVRAGVAVLDLGTGSGALALAIKQARPQWTIAAVDSSAAALAVARGNGERLGIGVRWLLSDGFAALGATRFDAIVCNPPYLRADDPALGGELAHEPRAALVGGADGLDAYRNFLAGAGAHLTDGGLFLLEHGREQRAAVLELAAAHGFATEAVVADLAGHDRVVVLRGALP